MAEKLKQGFDNYGEYWQVPGNEKKFRNKEDALKIGHKVEPTKKPKPKGEERMKPIEISPERKKAEEALKSETLRKDAKKLAIRDIRKKFPEGHRAVVEKAKENKVGQKGAPKKSVGLNARQFKRIFDKEDTIVPVHLFELWEQEGYSEKQARDAWEKYKNK